MASNQVIESISDELDSLLAAIQSFELTSSSASSRSNSRNGSNKILIADADLNNDEDANFTPVILRDKHLNSSNHPNQDDNLNDKSSDIKKVAVESGTYDTLPDQSQVAKELNQLLSARLSPVPIINKVKPVKPERAPSPKDADDKKCDADDDFPPPPKEFLMDALAEKLSRPPIVPRTLSPSPRNLSPAPSSPKSSPTPPPRTASRPVTPVVSKPSKGYINLPTVPIVPNVEEPMQKMASPMASKKSRHIKLVINPAEDGNKVKYFQLKMLSVTGSDANLIGKLLASSYVLEAKPDANSTLPRVVQSKTPEVQISDAVEVKIMDATSLEQMKEKLSILASDIKIKLETLKYELYDWRSDSKSFDAKIGFGSWDGIIAFEKVLMFKKVNRDVDADIASANDWTYLTSST